MKFEKKGIAIVIVAVLILIGYLLHPYIIEGATVAASSETKIATVTNQLSLDKYKNPTDPVVIGQKLNLKQQLRDLLSAILADTKIRLKPPVKTRYEKMLNDTNAEIAVIQQQLTTAQAQLKASRK